MSSQTFHGQLKTDWDDTSRGHEVTQHIVGMPVGQKLLSPLSLDATNFVKTKNQLQNKDRLTIFNTIGDGDVFWEGRLKADNLSNPFPTYKNFSTLIEDRVFMRLCHEALPATLEKPDGRIIHGVTHSFMEQGMSGSSPHLYDFSDQGYGSLNNFEDGDLLRVFSRVTDGQILWRGDIDADNNALKTGEIVQYARLGQDLVETQDDYKQSVRQPHPELFDRWQIVGFPAMLERNEP